MNQLYRGITGGLDEGKAKSPYGLLDCKGFIKRYTHFSRAVARLFMRAQPQLQQFFIKENWGRWLKKVRTCLMN